VFVVFFALNFLGHSVAVSQNSASKSQVRKQEKTIRKNFKKGKKYFRKDDYLRAAPYLKKCVSLNPEHAVAAFRLGVCYLMTGNVQESLPHFVRAYNLDQQIHPEIDLYLARAYHINEMFEEAIFHYEVAETKLEEEAPLRADIRNSIEQCQRAEEIIADPQPFQIKNLGEFVNSKYPEYAPTFTDDYSHMVFTSRRPRRTYKEAFGILHFHDIHEEVYNARLNDTTWMITELFSKPIPVNRHDAGIYISEDGNMLIYFIDKNDGDVFVSYKNDGKWSKRESISPYINTEHNEPSVFIADAGETLYYISDKPGGYGRRDLYVSKKGASGFWEEGVNMGEEFNTPFDEDAPFVTEDGKVLFFSSRGHSSIGGFDIFKCDRQPDGKWSTPENMGVPINSTFDDIYMVANDRKPGIYFFSSNRSGGYGNMDNYTAVPQKITVPGCGETNLSGIVKDPVQNAGIAARVFIIASESSDTIARAVTAAGDGSYQFVLPDCGEEYSMIVEVEGKMMAVTTRTGNVNILTGTVFDEITNQPLDAGVELVDPVSGKVLDQTWSSPKTGNYYIPVESGRAYLVRVKRNDYLSYYEEMKISPSGEIIAHNYEMGLQPFREANNKIVISWQFFDSDKYSIRDMYMEDMQNLYDVCKKVPALRLKIVGHTDSDGSDEYNQKLSERRANEVARLLLEQGVSAGRLDISGMGEKKPLYDNADDRLKRWNRRVEISIINGH